ncbi:hypothetical protein E1B28_010535 [Marasmius oreades]|uniref:Uncharacterized protein n=1 Tax=Marasmius oreades TaxID=181124 RepID=A0A9P7RY04_9AGAR|nr:uncharacterized protein E1B28_010535 [Marasmius oreades]KAG7091507.1 hypothetical protein E1B28_010535 [Marasmius oreades]
MPCTAEPASNTIFSHITTDLRVCRYRYRYKYGLSLSCSSTHQQVPEDMHFATTAILAAIAFFTTGTTAAECYSQGGSHRCSTADDVRNARVSFCNDQWGGDSASQRYPSSNDLASVFSHYGSFDSQQECWDSTEDIINTCLGHKDGGTWTVSSVQVNVNFCAA